jgi:uncharacterized alkaline shock family protein YloU
MTTPVEHAADAGDFPARWPEYDAPADAARPAQPVRQAVPVEQRGRTDIAERVVSRIAARAAGEVARVREVGERGPLTLRGGGARATVDGDLAALRLNVTVEYPAPLLHVAEEIRRHVTERIRVLTGLAVGHIDIDVTNVVPARTTPSTGYPEVSPRMTSPAEYPASSQTAPPVEHPETRSSRMDPSTGRPEEDG